MSSSPTGRLHSTPFNDEQCYLRKPTPTGGSGLQHEISASISVPSYPEPASPIYRLLHPALVLRHTRLSSASGGPANDGFPLAATVLTAPLPLGPRDSPVMKTED